MKVLIWNEIIKERSGGPPSYLFNLRESVKHNNLQSSIIFYHDILKERLPNQAISKGKFDFIKKLVPRKVLQNIKILVFIKWLKSFKNTKQLVDFNEFDVVHFHSTFDLFRNMCFLENFKGKVLLTSHTPKICFKEMIEDVFKLKMSEVWKLSYNRLEKIEIASYERADLVIFPCKEAMEPYYNTWSRFQDVITKKELDFFVTATSKAVVKVNKDEIFDKFGIPNDAFVVVYAGRHNEVKGYDVLKEFGEEVFKNMHLGNVYFLILGKEEPLSGLKHERWIEVGWTDDPHSIINAADVFILPNRETYFDLILLEVISLGKSVILSDTGGNKYFKRFPQAGLHYYDPSSYSNLYNCFLELYDADSKLSQVLKKKNTEIFDEYFSLEKFATRYYSLVSKL